MSAEEDRLVVIERRIGSAEETARGTLREVTDLRGAVGTLSTDVQGLASVIDTANRIAEQQEETAAQVRENAASVETVRRVAIEQAGRIRRVQVIVPLAVAAFALAGNFVAFLFIVDKLGDMLTQQQGDRIRSCQKRNEAVMVHVEREDQLADIETDPGRALIHRQSAEELRGTLVDCVLSTRITR